MTSLTTQHYAAVGLKHLKFSFAQKSIIPHSTPGLSTFFGAVSKQKGLTVLQDVTPDELSPTIETFLGEYIYGVSPTPVLLSPDDCCARANSTHTIGTALMCVNLPDAQGDMQPVFLTTGPLVIHDDPVPYSQYPEDLQVFCGVVPTNEKQSPSGFFGMISCVADTRNLEAANIATIGAGSQVDDSIFLCPKSQKLFQLFSIRSEHATSYRETSTHPLLYHTPPQSSGSLITPENARQTIEVEGRENPTTPTTGFVLSRRFIPLPSGTNIPPGVVLNPRDPAFSLELIKQAFSEVSGWSQEHYRFLDSLPMIQAWVRAVKADPTAMAVDLWSLGDRPTEDLALLFQGTSNSTCCETRLQLTHTIFRDRNLYNANNPSLVLSWEKIVKDTILGDPEPPFPPSVPELFTPLYLYGHHKTWDKDPLSFQAYRATQAPWLPSGYTKFDGFYASAHRASVSALPLKSDPATMITDAPAAANTTDATPPTNLPASTDQSSASDPFQDFASQYEFTSAAAASTPTPKVRRQSLQHRSVHFNQSMADHYDLTGKEDGLESARTTPAAPLLGLHPTATSGEQHPPNPTPVSLPRHDPGKNQHQQTRNFKHFIPVEFPAFNAYYDESVWSSITPPMVPLALVSSSSSTADVREVEGAHFGASRLCDKLNFEYASGHGLVLMDYTGYNAPAVFGKAYLHHCIKSRDSQEIMSWWKLRAHEARMDRNLSAVPLFPFTIQISAKFFDLPNVESAFVKGTHKAGASFQLSQPEHLSQFVSVWTFVASIQPDVAKPFRVPLEGFSSLQLAQILIHYIWFHAERFHDPARYMNLAPQNATGSPFVFYSQACGHLYYLYDMLIDAQFQSAWSAYTLKARDQGKVQMCQHATCTVLIHVVELVSIFLTWSSKATDPNHYTQVWPPGQSHQSFYCISGYIDRDNTLESRLKAWRTQVDQFRHGFNGANGDNFMLSMQPAHILPPFLTEPPPTPAPPKPPAPTSSTLDRPQPKKKGEKDGQPKDTKPTYNRVPFLASAPRKLSAESKQKIIDRAAEWSDPTHKPFLLQYNGKPICFNAIFGCLPNCKNEKCQLAHIDLEKDKPKQKALKPLMDYLMDSNSKPLRPTKHFKTQYAKLEQ